MFLTMQRASRSTSITLKSLQGDEGHDVRLLPGRICGVQAALNLTQPMMMTFPYLSQYGARKAGAAPRGAAAEAAKGSVSDKELGRALSRATKDGIVDPQQIHHLYHESLRSFLAKLPLGEGLQERAQGLMTLWGMMFGATENFNRRLTFIAAYRMAKDTQHGQSLRLCRKSR